MRYDTDESLGVLAAWELELLGARTDQVREHNVQYQIMSDGKQVAMLTERTWKNGAREAFEALASSGVHFKVQRLCIRQTISETYTREAVNL